MIFNRRSSTTSKSPADTSIRTGNDECVCTSINPAVNLAVEQLVSPKQPASHPAQLTDSAQLSGVLQSSTIAVSGREEDSR